MNTTKGNIYATMYIKNKIPHYTKCISLNTIHLINILYTYYFMYITGNLTQKMLIILIIYYKLSNLISEHLTLFTPYLIYPVNMSFVISTKAYHFKQQTQLYTFLETNSAPTIKTHYTYLHTYTLSHLAKTNTNMYINKKIKNIKPYYTNVIIFIISLRWVSTLYFLCIAGYIVKIKFINFRNIILDALYELYEWLLSKCLTFYTGYLTGSVNFGFCCNEEGFCLKQLLQFCKYHGYYIIHTLKIQHSYLHMHTFLQFALIPCMYIIIDYNNRKSYTDCITLYIHNIILYLSYFVLMSNTFLFMHIAVYYVILYMTCCLMIMFEISDLVLCINYIYTTFLFTWFKNELILGLKEQNHLCLCIIMKQLFSTMKLSIGSFYHIFNNDSQ